MIHGSEVHKYHQELASYAAYSPERILFHGVSNKKEVLICGMNHGLHYEMCPRQWFIAVW
jgi:hypothetical protein